MSGARMRFKRTPKVDDQTKLSICPPVPARAGEDVREVFVRFIPG
jgi:hypothetical protein